LIEFILARGAFVNRLMGRLAGDFFEELLKTGLLSPIIPEKLNIIILQRINDRNDTWA
jgi:hypothetical protein